MARKFTKEFKVQAVQRVLEDDRPLSEVARELAISVRYRHSRAPFHTP